MAAPADRSFGHLADEGLDGLPGQTKRFVLMGAADFVLASGFAGGKQERSSSRPGNLVATATAAFKGHLEVSVTA